MFKYKISVIVPVYNVEKYIRACLDSLVAQTLDKNLFEALLIIDGSPDNSEKICREYAEKYPCFKVFSKENEGLSKTRNYGLARAQGKYIAYLDSDDELTPKSLESLVNFFDKHENEVDIITYKITPVFEGERSKNIHYRYKYLHGEGVYDLTREENYYISQTNINICVRNRGRDNILFDTTENFRHEDQKYNLDIVRKKLKIGYCEGAEYLYTQNPASITSTTFFAYYIFETTTEFWENLFAEYPDKVPPYIQAMYVNDINWKNRMDILLPYHYDDERFKKAVDRLAVLLRRVDDWVILNHPTVEPVHRYFMMGIKNKEALKVKASGAGVSILKDGCPVFFEKNIPISVCRFKPYRDYVDFDAFTRSPVFSFMDKPQITAHLKNESTTEDIIIEPEVSSWDYYHAKIKTNTFWRIRLKWDYKNYSELFFTIRICDEDLPVRFEFIVNTPFNSPTKRTSLFRNGYEFMLLDHGFQSRKASARSEEIFYKNFERYIALRKPRTFLRRKFYGNKISSDRRVWLYYDCQNVLKDNGYYQYIHDFDKNDGVERYYVVNDNLDRKALFSAKQRKNIIKFGSVKHRRLFLGAEKIITAFAEHSNYNPFLQPLWPYYTDLFKADTVYLQHGVLHAFLPWKYSSDRMNAFDYEVVSTDFEVKNLTRNYGFAEENLIKSGMPRYDLINEESAAVENKILFAPTWRKYLIDTDEEGHFHPTEAKFRSSNFFKETYEFLHSEALRKLLEDNDWYLDFKLHPIFKVYADLYELSGDRVRIADNSVNEKSYKVFITDFSSYCFDFVYLKRTLMYFVPDDEMFRAGLNDYRKLDLPLEEGFGPFARSSDEALNFIKQIVENKGEPAELYRKRTDKFFLHNDSCCRDRIYEAIKDNR